MGPVAGAHPSYLRFFGFGAGFLTGFFVPASFPLAPSPEISVGTVPDERVSVPSVVLLRIAASEPCTCNAPEPGEAVVTGALDGVPIENELDVNVVVRAFGVPTVVAAVSFTTYWYVPSGKGALPELNLITGL